MFKKSKLLSAKQKISKLKEKYFNSTVVNRDDDDDDDVINFLPYTDMLENNKPGLDRNHFNDLNNTISPVHDIKSPRIEITSLFDDTEHNIIKQQSSPKVSLGNNLISHQHDQFPTVNYSPSELSYCSKVTNKTLKTESIVLSDLSNQFEHICFLSSSSDDENTIEQHPPTLSFPETKFIGRNSIGQQLQTSVNSLGGNSDTINHDDTQKKELSDSELSEVQSDINSTVFSHKEDSQQIYSRLENFKPNNNSEDSVLKKKEIKKDSEDSTSSCRTISDKKQTSSDPSFEFDSSSQTQGNRFTEASKAELESIRSSMLKKVKQPPQQSKTKNKTKEKHNSYKTTQHNNTPNLKLESKLKKRKSNTRTLKDGEVTYKHNRYIVKSRPTASDDMETTHKEISSPPKKSRCKYPKRPKTVLKHSTTLKPSKNRPILKSCVLIRQDESSQENKLLFNLPTTPSKLNGCDYEEVISQLLWNQVQLTRHFIHSHHQMYLQCCQAAKILSQKYNICN